MRIVYILLMQAACEWNIFRNSLATCARSQKNNCEISKLLRRACRCDARMAAVHTFNRAPHASRALFMSASSFRGRRDDIKAACKLRVWQLDNSSSSTDAKLFFNCFICEEKYESAFALNSYSVRPCAYVPFRWFRWH